MSDATVTDICCERGCSLNGHVCVSAIAPELEAAAPVAPDAFESARPLVGALDTASAPYGGVAGLVAELLCGDDTALDLAEAFVRGTVAIASVVKGAQSGKLDPTYIAGLLHDFANALEAHDAAADAALAAKFDTTDTKAPPS